MQRAAAVALLAAFAWSPPARAAGQDEDDPYASPESPDRLAPPRTGWDESPYEAQAPAPVPPPPGLVPPPLGNVPPPPPPAPVPPPPHLFARATAPEPPPDEDVFLRVTAELAAGAAGYALVGYGLGLMLTDGGRELDDTSLMMSLVFFGSAGLATAVKLAGDAFGQNANWWAPFLGQAIGGSIAFVVFAGVMGGGGPLETSRAIAWGAVWALPVVGGVIGFELNRSRRRRTAAIRAAAMPLAHGLGLSLSADF
jgi:hypothetical protein